MRRACAIALASATLLAAPAAAAAAPTATISSYDPAAGGAWVTTVTDAAEPTTFTISRNGATVATPSAVADQPATTLVSVAAGTWAAIDVTAEGMSTVSAIVDAESSAQITTQATAGDGAVGAVSPSKPGFAAETAPDTSAAAAEPPSGGSGTAMIPDDANAEAPTPATGGETLPFTGAGDALALLLGVAALSLLAGAALWLVRPRRALRARRAAPAARPRG